MINLHDKKIKSQVKHLYATYHVNYLTLMAIIFFYPNRSLVQDTTFIGRHMLIWWKLLFSRILSEYLLWSRYIKKQRNELRIYCERDNFFSYLKMQTKLLESYFMEMELKWIFPSTKKQKNFSLFVESSEFFIA